MNKLAMQPEDTMQFLLCTNFGIMIQDKEHPEKVLRAAIRTAWGDATRRVLSYHAGNKNFKSFLCSMVCNAIEKPSEPLTAENYDKWHEQLCRILQSKGNDGGFTFGHAQKLVNMTMKYLYLLHGVMPECVYCRTAADLAKQLHVPVDRTILAEVQKQLGIRPYCTAWSKSEDYDAYLQYQQDIRAAVLKTDYAAPIAWEFDVWNADATNSKS